MRAYVQLGKIGDILSVVPMLDDGDVMVVSKQYAHVMQRIPVKTCEYDGDWTDLVGAIRFAKARFPDVVVPQMHGGKEFPMRHRTPSFQLDQWQRCGKLSEWDNRPLNVIPSPFTPLSEKPHILYADHSQSSPFLHKDDLYKVLKESFPDMEVIRLSETWLDNFCDFVSIYNHAAAIVSVETAHLHLAKASKIPIIALATDTPSKWHGSAYSKRFAFHCRYGDYMARKEELVAELKCAIDKKRNGWWMTPWDLFSYNPSIGNWGKKRLTVIRHHPNENQWITKLKTIERDSGTFGGRADLIIPDDYAKYSVEDGRIFTRSENLFISYTLADPNRNGTIPCVIGYGELEVYGTGWRIKRPMIPKYGKNDWTGQEKNWVFFEHDSKLHAIYQVDPQQTVIQLDGEKVVREWKTPCPGWRYGNMRGGTSPIAHNGLWLRFFHAQIGTRPNVRYCMGALLMEPMPPFTITAVSKLPIASGNEQYFPDWKFWKPNVLIPYGAIKDGDRFIVSCGHNDSACVELILKESDLNL